MLIAKSGVPDSVTVRLKVGDDVGLGVGVRSGAFVFVGKNVVVTSSISTGKKVEGEQEANIVIRKARIIKFRKFFTLAAQQNTLRKISLYIAVLLLYAGIPKKVGCLSSAIALPDKTLLMKYRA
jgi:hypothetical protein